MFLLVLGLTLTGSIGTVSAQAPNPDNPHSESLKEAHATWVASYQQYRQAPGRTHYDPVKIQEAYRIFVQAYQRYRLALWRYQNEERRRNQAHLIGLVVAPGSQVAQRISEAIVWLRRIRTPGGFQVVEPYQQAKKTDATGRFTFWYLQAGTYEVQVIAGSGAARKDETLEVKPGYNYPVLRLDGYRPTTSTPYPGSALYPTATTPDHTGPTISTVIPRGDAPARPSPGGPRTRQRISLMGIDTD